jgi:hypothetical protein
VGRGDTASCSCNTGYVRLLPDGGTAADSQQGVACVVDKTCVNLRFLEPNSCRIETLGAPAVGLFFAVDYCAGPAVLPDALGDLTKAFKITEDGGDVALNVESYASVVKRDVESYVTFAIDVSDSVTQNADLVSRLVSSLGSVITSLQRPPGEPPVAISILAIGRFVQEYLPFTSNLGTVQSALDAIAADPAKVAAFVNGGGTSLHQAVTVGIHHTERMQALRNDVTAGGVLTTGTLVVVTDGQDTSGLARNDDLIKNTLVNVISVGISSEIDSADLTRIGRDGSFLAPTPEDFVGVFQEIATRVQEYPKRSYLLGYCSPATTGKHVVKVSLAGNFKVSAPAGCGFDAAVFGSNPNDVCNAKFFADSCAARKDACGGFACGACPDGQCCSGGTCRAPSATAGDCRNQDELCRPKQSGVSEPSKVCVAAPAGSPLKFLCAAPSPVAAKCDAASRCDPGVSYCEKPASGGDSLCVPLKKTTGVSDCGDKASHDAYQCPELNCAQRKADSPGEPYLCLPEGRVFDRCSGDTANAVCENGAACQNGICTARHTIGCTTDLDCFSGVCVAGTCRSSDACYFSWDTKITR